MIVIYSANVKWHLQVFFSILKFWFSRLSRCWKGRKWPKMTKISVCCTLYFRNHISHDLHLWYTCMYKRIVSPGIFLIFFFKILIFGIIRGDGGLLKGKKPPKMTKSFVCLTPYLRNCTSYIVIFCIHICKMMISHQIFSFSRILILGFFRRVKGQKMT